MRLPINTITRIIHAFAYMLGLIPEQLSIQISDRIGEVWYLLDWRHRKVALYNLKRAYANEKHDVEIRSIAKQSFRNIARIPFEIGWSLQLSEKEIMRRCKVNGLDHLRRAHAKGRGALILTLHIGNWELLPLSYTANGFKVSLIYRPLDFEPADLFFLHYRQRFGGQPIPKKKSMRKVLDALKGGDSVGILLDQDSGLTAGVFADFFGYPACTNKGMALLALKTGAPVIPTFLIRTGKGYSVHIWPEIPVIRSDNKESDIQLNTEQYNRVLEKIIRQYPEQWLWVHRRWKNRPVNDSSLSK